MTLSMVINYLLNNYYDFFLFLFFTATNHDTTCALNVLGDYLVW